MSISVHMCDDLYEDTSLVCDELSDDSSDQNTPSSDKDNANESEELSENSK